MTRSSVCTRNARWISEVHQGRDQGRRLPAFFLLHENPVRPLTSCAGQATRTGYPIAVQCGALPFKHRRYSRRRQAAFLTLVLSAYDQIPDRSELFE